VHRTGAKHTQLWLACDGRSNPEIGTARSQPDGVLARDPATLQHPLAHRAARSRSLVRRLPVHRPTQARGRQTGYARYRRHACVPQLRRIRRAGAQLSRTSGTLGNPGHGHPDSGEVVFFSLSHKRFGVSYCEIRRARVNGTMLRAAVTSADLGHTGLAERSISRCGTHWALCDRLFYASPALL
jgi:hypothetical protein